ncbi:MAG: hypothetical protein OEX02_14385 [Cyclobacteriaceae bacterium]|nr:hypothetical protein [Cyclobacteriaceae bacterium]
MDITEKIEAYLNDGLSQVDKIRFEQQMESDPSLKNEVDLQSEIINGIKEIRKAELKSMLNNIPTPGLNWMGGTNIQIISTVAVAVAAGLGAYFYWPSDNAEELSQTNGITQKEITTPEIIEHQVLSQTDLEGIATDKPAENQSKEQFTPAKNSQRETVTESTEAIKEISTGEAKPNIPDSFDVLPDNSINNPDNTLLDKTDYEDESVAVTIDNSLNKFKFHYQFKGTNLVLYGEFNETYEILDFRKNDKRALYLYYKNKYYSLNLDQTKITELSVVKDRGLTEDLNKVRAGAN